MVKYRGIEISIISQFDIRRLPEFQYCPINPQHDSAREKTASPTSNVIAACYVPIYAGSQIWFEYAVDGPHPPGAGYLFKLMFDGKVVTSWDCTEKHDFHGKMMYNLLCQNNEVTNSKEVARQAMMFSSELHEDVDPSDQADVVEIRVHRIEHRQRIRQVEPGVGNFNNESKSDNRMNLVDGGLLEPGFPRRRYKYQLLDAIDEPYATFRFYYRSLDFLRRHGIVDAVPTTISSTVSTPDKRDASSIPPPSSDIKSTNADSSPASTPSKGQVSMNSSPRSPTRSGLPRSLSTTSESYIPPSDSDQSLSIVTKDSIEDLPSSVPRSPKSGKSPSKSPGTFEEILENNETEIEHTKPPPSPSRFPLSPRRLFKKKLTVNINGTEFDLERKKRPLSPFTSAGMLRKLVPPSAPAAMTEFGPTVKDEVEKLEERVRQSGNETPPVPPVIRRTTRAERGGRQLMGFLGRRLGTRSG